MSELTSKLKAASASHRGTDLGGLLQWAALHIQSQDEALEENREPHTLEDFGQKLQAEILAKLADKLDDAERYQWIRANTSSQQDSRGRQEFILPDPHPQTNLLLGAVCQHLDKAIDAAIAAQEKPE